ncbi:flavin reductase family protein [Agrobacterium vitis]|uniref:flavin reductase n=1 Tax=Agrobacterium vitis TaxID=373 RepID=UPI0018D23536
MFQPINATLFRKIMRSPISSVAIVATGAVGNRAGCTVTAVCSLSDSPPSLLVCLNRQTTARAAIVEAGSFTVNYLAEGQEEDADCLAGRSGFQGDEKFGEERWRNGPHELPCLEDALAVVVCDVENIMEFGSHTIICATIREAVTKENARPLLYGQGQYRKTLV